MAKPKRTNVGNRIDTDSQNSPIGQNFERPNQKTVTPRGSHLKVIQGGAGRHNEDAAEGEEDTVDQALSNQAPQQAARSRKEKC